MTTVLTSKLLPHFLGLLAAFALIGCGQGGPPAPLPADQIPAALNKSFASAPANLKELSDRIVSSLQEKDLGKALLVLQGLCAAPELTKAQRDTASRALLTLNEQIQAAAAAGDPKAQEILRQRALTK